MSTPDIILKLSNVESYYGPIMAIRGISLQVPRGQIVTLLGANGAGKTTVLKTISGILDPQKGSIEFLGKPIQRMEADRIVRLGLSHVPEGREVFPFLSVRENLMMGAYLRRDRDGVAQDLERVYGYFPRLKERLGQPAGQLSGGEQQMLAIGRALMNRPTASTAAPPLRVASSDGCLSPDRTTKTFEKSIPPTRRPMIGLMISSTKLPTIVVKAAPMTTPTARSTTLPR